MSNATANQPAVDFEAVTQRQQGVWSKGDFARVATTTLIVAENLCESLDLRPGEKVLDVAAGSGNAALAAARRWCEVTATDYVPELLEVAQRRAELDHLPLSVRVADTQNLPFDDASFDVVISTFGAMFSPDQQHAADEIVRVCRPGGRIGLAAWTPNGMVGDWFRAQSKHVPPPPGLRPAVDWGTEGRLRELFGDRVSTLEVHERVFNYRYRSAEHLLEFFRSWYGPTRAAFETLDASGQDALARDLLGVFRKHNRSGGEALIAPAAYAESIAVRA